MAVPNGARHLTARCRAPLLPCAPSGSAGGARVVSSRGFGFHVPPAYHWRSTVTTPNIRSTESIDPTLRSPCESRRPSLASCACSLGASGCLLYTSDAADERSSVDLGGRRIIK